MTEENAALEADPNMPPLDVEIVEQSTEETPQADSAPVEQVETPAEPDEPNRVQERINKITADKYEEKRAREAEKKRADDLEQRLKALQQAQPEQDREPTLEDFDYDDAKFQSALIDYKVNKQAEVMQQNQAKQQQQHEMARIGETFNRREAEFASTATDYTEVIASLPPLSEAVKAALMLSEDGPKLAYYLGKHLDVADEIATATPMVAAMRLGQISQQLTAIPKTAQNSAAPEPVETLSSGGVVNKDLSDMTMDEIYNS